jgi:hypothetical protein
MQKVLVVFMPTYIRPTWERRIAKHRVDEIDFNSLSFLRQVLISPSFVQYNRSNPRTVEYMFNLARMFLKANAPKAAIELLVDRNSAENIPEAFRSEISDIEVVPHEGLWQISGEAISRLSGKYFDTVLLAYPDPIGLGWSGVERVMARVRAQNILVLNGRHRCFLLESSSRRMLLWRRFLARTWLVEIFLGIGLALWSIPLSIYDLTLRKWVKKPSIG